jgi:outer membrane protein assembly factor BamB
MPRLRNLRLPLALGALLLGGGLAGAANWDRFRGPNGTGVAADKDVPVKWTAGDGVLWKAAIPGVGHSSPVIWGDRVFLQSASADGKARWLLCLDAATGTERWKRAAPGTRARTHTRNTLASSTPAADGERVYAVFWDGRDINLCAYDFQGKLLWQRDLGGFTSQHGAGLSPVVYGGKVFLNNDQDGSAVLLALDARTGKTAWQAPRTAFRTCYSTPFVREKADGAELVVASTAGITGYDPATGAENWNYTWGFNGMALRTVASPVAAGGLVFANGGDGSGARHTIAVRLGGKGDVTGTHLAWEKTQKSLPYVPSLLASGDHVYLVNDFGTAACLVARTGAEVWSKRLGGGVSASPILVDGKIYAAAEDGSVYVFKAATTFALLARNTVGEPVVATPAVADGRLFIRGREHLFCIGKPRTKAVSAGP